MGATLTNVFFQEPLLQSVTLQHCLAFESAKVKPKGVSLVLIQPELCVPLLTCQGVLERPHGILTLLLGGAQL